MKLQFIRAENIEKEMAECTFTPNMNKTSERSGSRHKYDVQSMKTGYRPTSELNAKAYTTKFKFINLD